MRTHADIIREAGGYGPLNERLGLPLDRREMVKSWFIRDRIPQEYWRMLADRGVCTLDELATAAALKLAVRAA